MRIRNEIICQVCWQRITFNVNVNSVNCDANCDVDCDCDASWALWTLWETFYSSLSFSSSSSSSSSSALRAKSVNRAPNAILMTRTKHLSEFIAPMTFSLLSFLFFSPKTRTATRIRARTRTGAAPTARNLLKNCIINCCPSTNREWTRARTERLTIYGKQLRGSICHAWPCICSI